MSAQKNICCHFPSGYCLLQHAAAKLIHEGASEVKNCKKSSYAIGWYLVSCISREPALLGGVGGNGRCTACYKRNMQRLLLDCYRQHRHLQDRLLSMQQGCEIESLFLICPLSARLGDPARDRIWAGSAFTGLWPHIHGTKKPC